MCLSDPHHPSLAFGNLRGPSVSMTIALASRQLERLASVKAGHCLQAGNPAPALLTGQEHTPYNRDWKDHRQDLDMPMRQKYPSPISCKVEGPEISAIPSPEPSCSVRPQSFDITMTPMEAPYSVLVGPDKDIKGQHTTSGTAGTAGLHCFQLFLPDLIKLLPGFLCPCLMASASAPP